MLNTSSLDEIIQGCKKLKQNDQKTLYKKYYGYGMSICLRYATNEEDAVEILNDSFLKIFRKIGTLKSPNAFKGWLRMIVVNTALDFIRKNKKQFEMSTIDDLDMEAEEEPTDWMEIDHDKVLAAIQSLSLSLRSVFNLYVIDEYKHKEIGEALNISTSTSRAYLAQANKKLRSILNHELSQRS